MNFTFKLTVVRIFFSCGDVVDHTSYLVLVIYSIYQFVYKFVGMRITRPHNGGPLHDEDFICTHLIHRGATVDYIFVLQGENLYPILGGYGQNIEFMPLCV